ncbi:MAG: S-layer protein domain-containing protein, partial [Candidatus Methanoperedens sp.]|nr:S-layer protein domain-containing protein [Candidatus Methanoperedens sp.]
MIKNLMIILTFALLLAAPAMAANVTAVEIHGVVFDSSKTYNTTSFVWDAQNFTGFWYASGSGKSSETLTINQLTESLKVNNRMIQQENLLYNTSRTDTNYTLYTETGKKVDYGLSTGYIKGATGGKYAQLGWFGDIYVAVNGKANKLTKLIKSQKKDEKQTLKLGTSWNLGEGYNLTVESLDPETSPRQALLNFTKDGKTIDNKVVNEGEVYTYVEKSVSGESNVPVFVTYVESIFKGGEGMSALVQLRYTWLISQNVLEIKAGDKFGVFEVKEANENYVLLYNKEKTINLDQNTVQMLYGDLKFRVADSSTALRFYPILEKKAPGKYEVRGGTYDQKIFTNLVWDAQRFPGFWYALGSGKSSEKLSIVNQNATSLTFSSRVIQQENLLYNTSRTDTNYTLYTETGKKVDYGLSTGYIKGATGGKYAQLGWFGDIYVAVNGKANKLTKLIKSQKKDEKQTLKLGTSWNLGEGYNLTVESLDPETSPRQALLNFTKDGKTIDNKVVNEGEVYTYVEKSVSGESNVPV